MIMDPVLQRLETPQQLDKSNEHTLSVAGSNQNEEEKEEKVEDPVIQGHGVEDHGMKRMIPGEPGPSQKKIRADATPAELSNVDFAPVKLKEQETSDNHANSGIVPKVDEVETNESQKLPTDYHHKENRSAHPQPQPQPYQHEQYLHSQPHQQFLHYEYPPPLPPSAVHSQPLPYMDQQQFNGPTSSFNLNHTNANILNIPQIKQEFSENMQQPQQQLQQQQQQQQQQNVQNQMQYSHPQSTPNETKIINDKEEAKQSEIKEEEKEENYEFDIKEKLKEMGEISFETVKKDKKKATDEAEAPATNVANESKIAKKPDETESSTTIERKGNMRRNIREVMDETKLDESTLAAQRQEVERLRRVQEQQRVMRDLARQANQERVISLFQGNDFSLDGQEGPSSTKIGNTVVVKLPNGQVKPRKQLDIMRMVKSPTQSSSLEISPSSIIGPTHLTPSVSIAPVPKRAIETSTYFSESESEEEFEPMLDNEPVDVIDISSDDDDDDCIVVSETEDAEDDEDPTNSGMHTNDEFNQPDDQGRVVINIGHLDDEPDIYLAPQISRIIKPHQIGGIRFLYDNLIESTTRYENSTGFGCILAHSMGLGKTLQVVTFSDIFLRHTSAKTILCIMPINTLQNWLAEYNMWLPKEETSNSPLLAHGEVRPRNFNLHVLNDSHKTLTARAKVINSWNTSGGVLLIGYEQYRLLSLRRSPKSRSKKAQQRACDDDKNKLLFDAVHEALVMPGPDLVICDEGHRIKNSHASISQALKQMRTKRRVVLTGYPLQNNLMEYWCMVDFVRPNYLGSKTEFCNMFERPIQNGQCIDSTETDIKLMRYRAHVLHSLLLGFVQRRSHRVLQTALPQKEEYVLLVRMTPFQRTLYETFMNEVVRTQTVPNPLKAFAVCCKIWNHPDVLYYYLKKQAKGGAIDIDLEEVSNVKPIPVVETKPKKPPRVKKQTKKEKAAKGKPAASVTPYSSNNSNVDNCINSASSAPSSTPQNSNEPAPPNPPNPEPEKNQFSNPNQTVSVQGNYRMPGPGYNTQTNTQGNQPNYPGHNFRADFNQPPTQYPNPTNQYMNSSTSSSANYPQNNFLMNNDGKPGFPPTQAQHTNYNPNQNTQYSNPNSNANYMHQNTNPNTNYPHQQRPQPQQTQYHNQNPSGSNYQNTYGNAQTQNNVNYQQQPQQQGPSNMMQPYQQNYPPNTNQNYPQSQNYPNSNYQPNQNQNYWNAQHPEIKQEPYYDCGPYQQNNQWIKQEDVKPQIKLESDTKPKINIISDISIKNAYDPRGNITPEKKINILSDIKLEPKKEPVEYLEEKKEKEMSIDDQTMMSSDAKLESKLEKIDLDEDSKNSILAKVLREDTGIPYDWAVELLQDYMPGFIENSAKMEILFSIVRESLALGDRLLVFSQSLITLDLIEQFLQMNNVPGETQKWAKNTSYYRLDGSTTALEREKLINEFNSNSKVYLFLVSTRAGSLGINLIGANRVVVLDASWNPCHDTQAVCRVYRYGQRKPCFVYRLVVDNCLEKKIYDRQINKQGMSDRVVDECNPDAHLTMKDVTTLCWDDDRETEEKDWSYCKDKYIDVVLQKVLEKHGRRFNKEPFQHESLLIDRKDKQLSSLEKRMAKRGYEREKQAARQPNYSAGTGPRHRPVASVRPMQQEARSSRWIPAEHWQRQGMTAQEMTLPLDVVIPTVQPDKGKIVLKAGQKVLILKSPKGVYMQLESGKIVSIKTAIKVRGKADEDKSRRSPAQPSVSPSAILPPAIKNNSAVSVQPPKRAVKPFVPTPKINVRMKSPLIHHPPRMHKKVQKEAPPVEEPLSSSEDERSQDKRLNAYRDRENHMKKVPEFHVESRLRDVRGRHFEAFGSQAQTAKSTSALQQLEKSTSAIMSDSKQPFQETLNSITSSYQDNEADGKQLNQPITIDDDPEDKTSQSQHPKANIPPNPTPTPEYPYNYYGYNMHAYPTPNPSTNTAAPPPQPQPQPPPQTYTYAVAPGPPVYDMNAYTPQPQPQQSQHPPHPQAIAHHPSFQQPQQPYSYVYPPHGYPTPAPPQYTQPYEYSTPPQPIYAAPFVYNQPYPPPPQPVYASTSNPNPPPPIVYAAEYQYPPATDPATYYPPQT